MNTDMACCPENLDTPLQSFLRALMRDHRLNQSQFARRLGITATNISHYLSNDSSRRIVPSTRTLDTIATCFGADPDRLRELANRPGIEPTEDSIPALIDGIIVRLEALKRVLATRATSRQASTDVHSKEAL